MVAMKKQMRRISLNAIAKRLFTALVSVLKMIGWITRVNARHTRDYKMITEKHVSIANIERKCEMKKHVNEVKWTSCGIDVHA
jgi:uncharacterized membrane protein